MSPVLRLVPALCFALAALLFVAQGYFLLRSTVRGYDYGFAVDLTRDMTIQLAMIWMKVAITALLWVAFGLLSRLLIRAIDDLQSARAAIGVASGEGSERA